MTEERQKYHTGPADAPEPVVTTEDRIAQAQARQVGLSYERREQWLQRLPERLRGPSDHVLGGKMSAEGIAYALAASIDGLENAPGDAGLRRP